MISRKILSIKKETPTISTLEFEWDERVNPGQFIMVWVPKFGEVPMSLSNNGGRKAITVKNYGKVSDAILNLKPEDRLFFRGPYGNGFSTSKGRNLIVGGGSGMASLKPLINNKSFGIVSARTKDELLFVEAFDKNSVIAITDDGSSGNPGYPVDYLKRLDLKSFENIYVCGPELMLKSVYDFLRESSVVAELSLERSMKCGIGVCDSCSIDGLQLCKDGPVFSSDQINDNGEFGNQKLSHSGKRVKVSS